MNFTIKVTKDLTLTVGDTIKLDFGPNNLNNKVMHIRGIIDREYIVYKVWSKRKQCYRYFVEHVEFFKIAHDCIKKR